MTRGQSLLFPVGVLDFPSPSLSGLVFLGRPLPVEVEVCAILPMMLMDAYPNRMHPVSPDAEVGIPQHFDVGPTPDIAVCP